MKNAVLFILFLGLGGCASSRSRLDTDLAARKNVPRASRVENVPFIEQTANYCGPATLAMAMQWAGRDVSIDLLAQQVYVPGRKGSLPSDLIGAARRNGFVAVPLTGLPSLIDEIAAGHPVIVFENLGFRWLPQWHYAVVHGYDLDAGEVILHSGHESDRRWNLRRFSKAWEGGESWGLVVLPPGKLAASADDLAHVASAASLEEAGRSIEAELVYKSVLERWPRSLAAHLGLANVFYSRGDALGAAWLLTEATRLHPEAAMAWHNLAIAQRSLSRKSAGVSAARALALAPVEWRERYRENLKDVMTESGPL